MSVKYSESKNSLGKTEMKVAIALTKELCNRAEIILTSVTDDITKKLETVHKENILASYSPRSSDVETYTHTDTLIDAVYGTSERKNKYESRVMIKVRPDLYPENHSRKDTVTATKVYKWLRDGTHGRGEYWFENEEGNHPLTTNYSTVPHLFEEHTRLQMKNYLESLDIEKIVKNRRYEII